MPLKLCLICLAALLIHGNLALETNPSVPQNLQLKPVSPSKAVLSWSPPLNVDGLLIGYHIKYTFDKRWWIENNVKIVTEYAFENLRPNNTITATLCARIEKDRKYYYGNYSGEVNLTMPTQGEWERMSATTGVPPTTAAITTGRVPSATPAMATPIGSTLMPTTAMTGAPSPTALATATPTALVTAVLVTSMALLLA